MFRDLIKHIFTCDTLNESGQHKLMYLNVQLPFGEKEG